LAVCQGEQHLPSPAIRTAGIAFKWASNSCCLIAHKRWIAGIGKVGSAEDTSQV